VARYVALLRGINVGGRQKLKMADLRALLSDLGYHEVATLLQSGNAVFTAESGSPELFAADIQTRLADETGLTVTVMVRTADDLRRVVEQIPFEIRDPAKCAVAFLSNPVDPGQIAAIDHQSFAPEELVAGERELYLYFPGGMGRSKLLPILARDTFGPATVRNWNTTTRLLDLAEESAVETS
jgi:uncharacterized protein (DUF1697 family)